MTAVELAARPAVRALEASRIREVANAAMGRDDVLAFWFGEPDTVTPAFIREAAQASLAQGETFYSQNLGLPALRDAIASYGHRLHGRGRPERIAVTASGMSALALAGQALLSPGDRVVVIGPAWPNLVQGPRILGASVQVVPLDFGAAGWTLDLDRLLQALTPSTRLLILNSPANPTGWTMAPAAQQQVLAHCRRHGIWILSDDAYERLYLDDARLGARAPVLADIADDDDRLISANTFSKTWQMTGWRLGWLDVPPALMGDLSKLIEFNTSCVPVFVQRAGIAAVESGEPAVEAFVSRLRAGRDALLQGLQALPGVRAVAPPAAMYAFFAVDGMTDSVAFCRRLVTEHGLGLAPGVAFGSEGEGFLRWCFAASPERIADGLSRFSQALRGPSPLF
ncbi:pyridoxal phosphate-dependent aminotransferase [Rubrivivax albus]|nr:pyridoxal phosphate-dependent aminotransferase [Rubrivivax albus]